MSANAIPMETLRKLRRLEIRTGRLVDEVLAGAYRSAFKGRGMEFEDVREYAAGDEVRTIDWNVTARTGHPFVKTFREERELTVVLAVDVSASGRFGTTGREKREVATEIAALVALSAVRGRDKVGLLLFTDRVEHYVPPRKGNAHALRVIRDLYALEPRGRGTRIETALAYLGKVLRKRAVLFLISDLETEGFERALAVTAARHDVISVRPVDPRERGLEPAGLVEVEDAETGERTILDCASAGVRRAFGARWAEHEASRAALLRRRKVDAVEVEAGRPYDHDLRRLFERRRKRIGR